MAAMWVSKFRYVYFAVIILVFFRLRGGRMSRDNRRWRGLRLSIEDKAVTTDIDGGILKR
jgi:hypothetical protein